jgi:cytochrome b6-f complex iron-sulfur subunit
MNSLSRRSFLKFSNRLLTVTGLAVIIGPVLAYFYPPKLEETPSEPVLVGNADELPEGESKTVRFGRYPALIINTRDGLRAYSAVCTHFACICKWDPDIEQIVCPCHEGYFDALDGHVVSGPPPEPLEPLNVEVVDNEIYVGGEV